MKFLLYGINGWIGSKVFKLLKDENIEVVAGNCRVNDISALENEIKEVSPTHIISLIGRTHGVYNNKVYAVQLHSLAIKEIINEALRKAKAALGI